MASETRLRRWREANGLSLQEISDLTGVSTGMLSRLERDMADVTPMTKVKIARRLKARVADLFEVEPLEAVAG